MQPGTIRSSHRNRIGVDPTDAFVRAVARRVTTPIVPYSLRLQLLSEAHKRGIGRFQANLIIAIAQHQAQRSSTPSVSGESEGNRWFLPIATVITIQALILCGAWCILH